MKTLKAITYKKAYEKLIADKIINWLWDTFFKGCFEILDKKTVFNDINIIRDALINGQIFYQDGAFYSQSGRFRNELAKELEALGAKYSKYRKAYLLEQSKVPAQILWAIDTVKAQTAAKVALLQAYLSEQIGKFSEEAQKLLFDSAVEQIMTDLQERVYKNAKERKIELITPKLSNFRKNEIAKNYTNNLNFWIKNWSTSENFNNVTIPKMRAEIGRMAIAGKSTKDIENYLLSSFTKCKRHAHFLAFNETKIATTSYLTAKYKEEGFTHFKWIHTGAARVPRPYHKDILNGQIFPFNEPPIIDEATGQRGMPGEIYNCHCKFEPVINDEWLANRRKLFKAQNSLFNTLKEFFMV